MLANKIELRIHRGDEWHELKYAPAVFSTGKVTLDGKTIVRIRDANGLKAVSFKIGAHPGTFTLKFLVNATPFVQLFLDEDCIWSHADQSSV